MTKTTFFIVQTYTATWGWEAFEGFESLDEALDNRLNALTSSPFVDGVRIYDATTLEVLDSHLHADEITREFNITWGIFDKGTPIAA